MSNVYVYDITVTDIYSEEDFGSIASSPSTSEDYQQISSSSTSSEDWYAITSFETQIPFGSIGNISGSAEESISNKYDSSGSVQISSILTENVTFVWIGNGTLFEIGNGLERTLRPYVSSGTLRVGENSEAVVNFASSTDSTTLLTTVSGSALESETDNYVASGLITISQELIHPNIDYTPAYTGTGIVNIFGNSIEKTIPDYVGSGTLFGFGEKLESKTWNYNESSISIFEGDTYGLISNAVTLTDEYGSITIPANESFDFGVIIGFGATETLYPFGGAAFSGNAIESFSANTPENTQLFTISGAARLPLSARFIGLGTLTLSGSAIEKDVDSYVGIGTLTFSGTGLESLSAQTPENTQLFSISGISSNREIQVYGINPGDHLYPQPADISSGLITITNTTLIHPFVDYTPHYGIDKNIGVGTTGIQLSGSAVLRDIESYVGTGTLFEFGEKLESRTYVYDEYDLIELLPLDYGLISSALDQQSEDYGNLEYTPSIDNYGLIYDLITGSAISSSLYPFGSIYILNGFSPQESYPWLPGPGVGRSWSFTQTTYIASGITTISGISSNREIQVYGRDYITSGTLTLSASLVEKNTESYVGVGTLTLSGTGLESLSAQTPENTQLFSFSSGYSDLQFIAQTPENTQLFSISGAASDLKEINSYVGLGTLTLSASLVEKNTESYVGVGTLTFSGTALEALSAQTPENTQLFSFSSGYSDLQFIAQTPEDTQLFIISGAASDLKEINSYVGLGTLTLSGTAIEKVRFDTPENTPLFVFTSDPKYNLNREYTTTSTPPPITLSGELVHPNIDYTPHYGIEKNIGIGTTGIQFRRGVGYTPDSEGNPRDARTYSNRYPINDKVPGTGIGTITFDQTRDLAKYSPLTPYAGTGLFNIVTGFSPQQSYPWLPGPGVGKSWSFTRTTYIASGITTISGISSNREIAVYGYYGNDNNPGTSGTIFISQQTAPIIVLETDSYVGAGTYFVNGSADIRETYSYRGSGTLTLSGTALEALSAQTPENTQLFSISGTGLEVYSAQTPEIEVLYVISGSLVERTTNAYNGSGSVTVTGSATTRRIPNYPARGLFRFATHNVDNNYDTCDSEEFTCDNQDSANIKFVANPVETTILFNISGIASTREIATYQHTGIGTHVISGSVSNIKLTHSEVGLGTIFTVSSSLDKEVDTYVGLGTLLTLSGSAEVYSAQTPESTILLTINGSATTRIESDYPVVGIGLINLSGTSSTRKITSFTQIGSGLITLSGQLVYPDIIYIPSPDGSGSISIIGSGNDSLTKIYKDTSGSLFGFSSGFESFSRSTYTGLGTIYVQQISGITTNNPFQIPRTYVVVI